MKTKIWALLLVGLLALCIGTSVLLLKSGQAECAQIWSDGELIMTVDLRIDQEHTVTTGRGTNVITVENGAIAVTSADCPDGYCMDRGFCTGGAQIVCLPNRLVIAFVGRQETDGVVG